MLDVTDNFLNGDFEAAKAQHLSNFAVAKAMFQDPNPCPIKKAMAMRGVITSPFVRLPLVPSDDKVYAVIKAELDKKDTNALLGA